MKLKLIICLWVLTFFNTISAQEVENKELVFEYSLSYGSVCCPKDLKWNEKEAIKTTIQNFEKENNVLMKGTYKTIDGKEGECTYYFSFLGWDTVTKKKFLNIRYDLREIKRYTTKRVTLDSLLKTKPYSSLVKVIN